MNENKKTTWFIGVAVGLVIIAMIVSPGRITPSAFMDQGEAFFPDFTDPNSATTLEIVEYDETTGTTTPFKVTFKNGLWTIPSHHDYPADAGDRLAKTAAGMIDIRKDDFRSDNVADHEACGVIDPMDENAPGLTGRGKLVMLKDANENILANFIVGNQIADRPGFRFVRVPGQKRIYAVKMDIDLSTAFADWIDTDLLQVDKAKIDRVTLLDYSIDERTRRLNQRDNLILTLNEGTWKANRQQTGQQVDSAKMDSLIKAIDGLSIVGVRPKPAGLSANLHEAAGGQNIGAADRMSLQSKGFYFTREGDLKSNEGELVVRATDGVVYTLRFGEVLYGTGLAVTSGGDVEQGQKGTGENRYLFITADFDQSLFPEPREPENLDFLNTADSLLTETQRADKALYNKHQQWKRNVERGRVRSDELNARFAGWYYVISSESFDRLHLNRSDLVIKKES